MYRTRSAVTKPDEPVVYYLLDGPQRGFVREELQPVPKDTQLPPNENVENCVTSFSVAFETSETDVLMGTAFSVINAIDRELLGVFWIIYP